MQRAPLALLIDAENVPVRHVEPLLAAIARFGDPLVRRAYADFTLPAHAPWAEACDRLGIVPRLQRARPNGKNAADIALAVDAMDLLHAGGLAGICLASSDSDFTSLAHRLREGGLNVFGFGEGKTPPTYRAACHAFEVLEQLSPRAEPPAAAPSPPARVPARAPPAAFEKLLNDLWEQVPKTNGRAHGSQLMDRLMKAQPGFRPDRYGHATLGKLVAATPGYTTVLVDKQMFVSRHPIN